jgi:hypothetical protein
MCVTLSQIYATQYVCIPPSEHKSSTIFPKSVPAALATPASVSEDYVAFVVVVGKRRGERSVTKSLPEPWYGLCVFTELSINRDYFRIQN